MARPRVNINQSQFENLCKMQCTLEEIAGWFDCSHDTIERWCKRTYKKNFKDVYNIKSKAGLISLRRSQFKLAEKNASMAIFLGKNYLGQKDKIFEQGDNTEETLSSFFDKLADSVKQNSNNVATNDVNNSDGGDDNVT